MDESQPHSTLNNTPHSIVYLDAFGEAWFPPELVNIEAVTALVSLLRGRSSQLTTSDGRMLVVNAAPNDPNFVQFMLLMFPHFTRVCAHSPVDEVNNLVLVFSGLSRTLVTSPTSTTSTTFNKATSFTTVKSASATHREAVDAVLERHRDISLSVEHLKNNVARLDALEFPPSSSGRQEDAAVRPALRARIAAAAARELIGCWALKEDM
jgi:hypothetical protein